MPSSNHYFLKRTPFIRLLLALIIGIVFQWYCQVPITAWLILFAVSFLATLSFFYLPLFKRYHLGALNGLFIMIPFLSLGAILVFNNDIRNNPNWMGHLYNEQDVVVATIEEPLAEKTKSFKADATISSLIKNGGAVPVKGKTIIYFQKDSSISRLKYGSQIIFRKSLQEIKNSGNPGGFDYKRYSLFHGMTHQVYLKAGEFVVLNEKKKQKWKEFIYASRENVLDILRSTIKGEKELGLAEALLIGYKDDLDKTLVQSYTNTGVVHIIAISGLHLGLIYWLLLLLLKPLQKQPYCKWLKPVIVISGLWLFSFLAGAQPSILRSAVMFTCLALGDSLVKKTSIYNTLAFSAFLLLCYNPYWLWDVGFQLSYSAVLSIVVFMKPVYQWFYVKNKALDFIWKINAVTIAAQILTLPVSIYHFHQFPMHFLLTNFVAVPLSSIILVGEIFLCVLSFVPFVASFIGKLISWLIWVMNGWVERIEALPFSLWDGLQVNIMQVLVLFISIAGFSYWLLEKKKPGLITGLIGLLLFFTIRSISFWQAVDQQKLIVYNVPQRQAIDFITGRQFIFCGDSDLLKDDFIRNFHLKPSRILHRTEPAPEMDNLNFQGHYFSPGSKKIMLLDSTVHYSKAGPKHSIDVLIISKNPKLYIPRLHTSYEIKQVVFDGSLQPWRVNFWKKDCDSLNIPYHDVTEKGAFVMNLN
ncbi:ComEC/Rec2 family competence protein [Terrimonas alba]|uniref:ComEC/Rec2 family competence protein n=1 Tax=Terrimonas alba TaxID=3349636 RepID=UPI0035F3967E